MWLCGGPTDDHTNVTSKYTYDMLDRKVSATDPRGFVTRSFYDADSRTTKSVQNCVDATTGSLRCDQATTPDNQSFTNVASTTAYDAAGNATLAVDPAGNQTVIAFDALNRPLEAIQQSADATPVVISDQQTGYDEAGDVISAVVDPAGKHLVTSTTYDGAGRKKNVIAPPADPNAAAPDPNGASNVTTYSYDADSNVTDTQVSNSRVSTTGNVVNETAVGYDALGRATQKVEQAQVQAPTAEPQVAQTTSFQYDKDGRTTQTTDASGTTTTSYDGVGRVVGVLHPGATQPDTSSYDLSNRVTTTTNSAGTTKTYYDVLWRVVKEEQYDANGALISTTGHAYDAQGHELAPITTLANGTQSGVTYSYDPLGRISTVSDSARTYTYDSDGRVGTMTVYADAAKTTMAYQATYGYDAGTRTSTLTDKVGPSSVTLHSYGYSYDTANNRTAVTEDGTTTKYLYDDLNELTKVTDATGTTTLASYTYDANHNRATMTTAAGTTSYTYDAATGVSGDVELKQKTDPDGTLTTYRYDTAGDLTQAVSTQAGVSQTTTYVYDVAAQGCAKRLCEVDRPDGTHISFSYDADGNRLSKTVTTGGPVPTTTVTKDVYQAGRIAYETDGAGITLATFSYDAGGMPASVQVGSDPATAPRYYYIYNGHGDVVALTDASGNAVATYSYDVFGALTSATESFANGWSNPYRYDGKDRVRYDSETCLYWMSVRAYDPALGRFLSRDPLNRQPLAWQGQPYVYGANNPLANIDPSGQAIVDPESGAVFIPHKHSGIGTTSGASNKTSGDPCAHPTQEFYETCYQAWEFRQLKVRNDTLAPMVQLAGASAVFGYGLDIIADVDGIRQSPSAAVKVEDSIDLVINIIAAFHFLPWVLTGSETSFLGAGFDWAIEAAHGAETMLRGVLAALHAMGVFAEAAADAVVAAATAAVGGIPGLILKAVDFIAGPVVNNLVILA